MSFSLASLGVGGAALANTAINVLIRPPRKIGTLVPDCVLSEDHDDELEITNHPVERSADITDHAYNRPPEVSIRCAWPDASFGSIQNLVTGALNGIQLSSVFGALTEGIGGGTYSQQMYANLLALQASRTPVAVITGKRSYQNMLIRSISVHTDRENEYTLMVNVRCRNIILVSATSSQLPAAANQSQPQTTASPQTTGTQSPQSAPTTNNDSILKGIGSSTGGALSTGAGYAASFLGSFFSP